MPAMERLIWVTWRAFWIGLGASLVLIVQAFAPSSIAPSPAVEAKAERAPVTPRDAAACTTGADAKSADPILSRNPFDSKTGPLITAPAKRPRGA
jgi:hypothetical protein